MPATHLASSADHQLRIDVANLLLSELRPDLHFPAFARDHKKILVQLWDGGQGIQHLNRVVQFAKRELVGKRRPARENATYIADLLAVHYLHAVEPALHAHWRTIDDLLRSMLVSRQIGDIMLAPLSDTFLLSVRDELLHLLSIQ